MLKPFAIVFTAAAVGVSAPVVGVLPGDAQVDISWKTPSSPVEFVVVEQSVNGGANWKQIALLPGSANHYLVEELTNGTSYWFRIKWLNKGIPSAPS
ncbi:MAG: fibronectin type III domain-containing protein, partial [Burkholderiaceae bacterium]|nr:fibronectin type III domain-containing protein [Burkholderiaceae bacterium]